MNSKLCACMWDGFKFREIKIWLLWYYHLAILLCFAWKISLLFYDVGFSLGFDDAWNAIQNYSRHFDFQFLVIVFKHYCFMWLWLPPFKFLIYLINVPPLKHLILMKEGVHHSDLSSSSTPPTIFRGKGRRRHIQADSIICSVKVPNRGTLEFLRVARLERHGT
jgi:hypothetical protein